MVDIVHFSLNEIPVYLLFEEDWENVIGLGFR